MHTELLDENRSERQELENETGSEVDSTLTAERRERKKPLLSPVLKSFQAAHPLSLSSLSLNVLLHFSPRKRNRIVVLGSKHCFHARHASQPSSSWYVYLLPACMCVFSEDETTFCCRRETLRKLSGRKLTSVGSLLLTLFLQPHFSLLRLGNRVWNRTALKGTITTDRYTLLLSQPKSFEQQNECSNRDVMFQEMQTKHPTISF